MFKFNFVQTWTCSRRIQGFVFDNDGTLVSSARYYRAPILDSALRFAEVASFDNAIIAEIDKFIGKSEWLMSFEVGKLLRRRFPGGSIAKTTPDEFFYQFARARAAEWQKLVTSGALVLKEGVGELLARIRRGKYFTAMYSDAPRVIALETIGPLLKADDLFTGERLMTCDDKRLSSHPKQHPLGWRELHSVAKRQSEIRCSELVAVEDGAEGAVGALSAGYGAVIVVPDRETRPFDRWDEGGSMESHLTDYPEHAKKLFLLNSLSDIKFD